MNERPILGTESQAQALGQLLRKRIVGGPGIDVRDSPEAVLIALSPQIPLDFFGALAGVSVAVVAVKKDGGSAGGADQPCTVTYSFWMLPDYDDRDLVAGEKQQPLLRRTDIGQYVPAADGTLGLAVLLPNDWVGRTNDQRTAQNEKGGAGRVPSGDVPPPEKDANEEPPPLPPTPTDAEWRLAIAFDERPAVEKCI